VKSALQILVIAPHPFYQERGTPIACRLLCETLAEAGHQVDLLAYPEGNDITFPNLRIFRTIRLPFLKNIPIGLSFKKLVCDGLLIFSLIRRFSQKRYDVIHAGEESVFLAVWMRFIHGASVIYDMDSSLADQVVEKFPSLAALSWFLNTFEQMAFRETQLVLPVCEELAQKIRRIDKHKPVEILEDVYFEPESTESPIEDLRKAIPASVPMMLYIGNLEKYQGIDLLLDALVLLRQSRQDNWVLNLVGGIEDDVVGYRRRTAELDLEDHVKFLGPRPLIQLPQLLAQADILISPRIKGGNTPMKLYSYLASGKPVVATRIRSHTQAIDEHCSVLVEPNSSSMADGLQRLLSDRKFGNRIGEAGRALAHSRYSVATYRDKLLGSYERLTSRSSAEGVI
jgi:glycosyltransferase involved in cell wall biosynthesis